MDFKTFLAYVGLFAIVMLFVVVIGWVQAAADQVEEAARDIESGD